MSGRHLCALLAALASLALGASETRPYAWRGLMLDESRFFFGKQVVKETLDRMADCGLNVFHWHLTDDQGWRLEIRGCPELTTVGAFRKSSPKVHTEADPDGKPYGPFFYTEADVREIVAYAAARGIRVVPEIELPGHIGALLTARPEFSCRGEVPSDLICSMGIHEDVLCVGNDAAIRYLEHVLDEVCRMFPDEVVHIGGDECPTARWEACPKCRARMKAEGIGKARGLQSWVTRRFARYLEKKGRRAMGWDEILGGGGCPSNVIVQTWREPDPRRDGGREPAAVRAARLGHDVVLSPLKTLYFSLPAGPDDPGEYRKPVAAYAKGFGYVTPEKVRAFSPTEGFPAGLAGRVLGAECCCWSEGTRTGPILHQKTWPRAAIFAEALRRSAAPPSGAWIAYPGDYGIWWGNRTQARRLKWCNRMSPTWPLYAPYPCVTFTKTVPWLAQPEAVEIVADGSYTVGCSATRIHEPGARLGRFTVPAGTNVTFYVRVFNDARPPALRVKGRLFASDATWRASWQRADDVAAETVSGMDDTPPGLARLPVRNVEPAKTWRDAKGRLFADFGRETYGYLKLREVRGTGALKIVYAESLAEAEAEEADVRDDYKTVLDGWELLPVDTKGRTEGEILRDCASGFRYACVRPWEGSDVTVGALALDEERKPVKLRGAFRCDDEEVNRIWEVAARTLELTRREVLIEGIKRDHWIWSGDAVQNFLMEYYSAADYEGVKHTLWALRGKEPVLQHLNRIMDYSWYWFDAVAKYHLYTGDETFLRQVYPRMRSFIEWGIGRLDANGRPHDRPGDWMFIDWAPSPLSNEGGVTAFEQMLFVRALEATSRVAARVGAADDAAAYQTRAAKLRAEVKPLFWNEERGCLMHLLRDDGTWDPQVTRYPNMFGLFFGYFTPVEAERVVKNVILNDAVMKIQTPYMRFYELEALCSLGRQAEVLKEMKAYWGGMLKLGATSFWELYNPCEKGAEHYAMYGRDFGRSLCHAWGASPLYLLGRYYLGVEPTKPGYAEYRVVPALGGLRWMRGKVPTPQGDIEVCVDGKTVRVKGVKGCVGTVVCGGVERTVRGDEAVELTAK